MEHDKVKNTGTPSKEVALINARRSAESEARILTECGMLKF